MPRRYSFFCGLAALLLAVSLVQLKALTVLSRTPAALGQDHATGVLKAEA